MSDALKAKLETVRSLLGPQGASMSYAELFDAMSDISTTALTAKRFGKKRAVESVNVMSESMATTEVSSELSDKEALLAATKVKIPSKNRSYIPAELEFRIWQRDKGACVNCRSKRNLNYDHIRPLACGGESTLENLRLLCFSCNQRASTKWFGKIYEKSRSSASNPK